MKFGNIGSVVSEEKSFEIVDGRRRRMTEPAYTISSPGAFGSGELNIHTRYNQNDMDLSHTFLVKSHTIIFFKLKQPLNLLY